MNDLTAAVSNLVVEPDELAFLCMLSDLCLDGVDPSIQRVESCAEAAEALRGS